MKTRKVIQLSLAVLVLLPSLAPADAFRYAWHRRYRSEYYEPYYAHTRVVYVDPVYEPERVVYVEREPAPCEVKETVVTERPREVVYVERERPNNVAGAAVAGLFLGAIVGQALWHHR